MADEQTPQSDLIDDAIRQAERQLEEKLEALRMSALGEPAPARQEPADDVAVLRPTGRASSSPRADEPAHGSAPAPVAPHGEGGFAPDPEVSWREADSDDLTFRPSEGSVTLHGAELYVPEQEDASFDERPHELVDHDAPRAQAHPALSSDVTGLTPVWEETDAPVRPVTHEAEPAPVSRHEQPSVRSYEPRERQVDAWDRPEPVHASWTQPGRPTPAPSAAPAPGAPSAAQPLTVTAVPSEDELQFWAQTRTALRTLQQLTESIPGKVGEDVTRDVARIAHEAVAPTDQTLRAVQQQLQQQLPRLQDRLEAAIEQALVAPTNGLRQMRDELPQEVDRAARELRVGLREDLDHTAAAVHGAVQQDVAQLEQSIATNVTRMAQGTTDAVGRVERDVDVLGEAVVRLERGMNGEFDRVEAQLRAAIDRVEQSVREELVEPTETVRKLDEELPARFSRVERTVLEQVQSTQRELSTALSGIVEASRASLDRIASMASTLDEDRARRAEDVEIIVDTVTTGWEGLAGAMKTLFEQQEETFRRIAGIEQRLTQIRDLEGAVEETMTELRGHVRELTPAPIVVTVAHPDAEVQNTARGGWLPESRRD